MKKWLLFLFALIVLFAAGTYVFIPSVITIASSEVAKTTDIGAERVIIDENKWAQWWNYGHKETAIPGSSGEGFRMGDYTCKLTGKFYKSAEISINNAGLQLSSKLVIVPLGIDSTGIQWTSELPSGNNPIARFQHYREAIRIKKNMDAVLSNLRDFLSKTENVYGINVERTQLKDTLYVSAKTSLSAYPSVKDIYNLIGKINTYLTKNNSPATGSPIYNITQMDQAHYQLMAAVPTDRKLQETEGFAMKNMIKGSFMITEVVGGEKEVAHAWQNLRQYFQDYRKTSMAMNFTMLVTDRMLQPDSSKWVTKLYMPVY